MSGKYSTHGAMINGYNLVENFKGRDHLEDLGKDQRIIIKWMLQKWEAHELTQDRVKL
jgi:hypothetical protein